MNTDNLVRHKLNVNYCLTLIYLLKLYCHLRKETMMSENKYDFKKLNNINVDHLVQKKGRFNYVSWSDVWTLFLQHDQNAVFHYGIPQEYN